METIRLTPEAVRTTLPGDKDAPAAASADERVRQLEHLLRLERARREAIEAGLDRLSARCDELARENAALRERLGLDVSAAASS